jgi:hypothetical protein
MKNKFNLLMVVAVMVFVIGCSCGNLTGLVSDETTTGKPKTSDSSNKTVADKVSEEILDGETTGVQECDDFIKFIAEQSKSPDDNWVTRGMRDYIIGQIKKSLRESLELNKNDKVKMAEQCKDLRAKFESQLNAEKEKNK